MDAEQQELIRSNFQAMLRYVPRQDVLTFFKLLAEVRRDIATTERDIVRIRAERDVLVAQLESRHALLQDAMGHLFTERRAIIHKHFAVIDHGIKSNNQATINQGLGGLADIIRTNPFTDLQALAQRLENGDVIEI